MCRSQFSFALLPALLALYALSHAQTCTSNSLTFHTKVGDWNIHILNDGPLRFSSNPFLVPLEVVVRAFKFYRPKADPYVFTQNVALLRREELVVLVDAGSGSAPSPFGVAGKVPELLRVVGTSPEEITHVVLTHAHGDHLGGLLTTEGRPVFPNAKVVLSRQEHEFWSQSLSEIISTAPHFPVPLLEMMSNAFNVAMAVYSGRIQQADSGETLFPGLQLYPTPGHSPGHVAVSLSSNKQKLMILGDAILTRTSSIQHPEWNIFTDMNATQAVATRLQLLEELRLNQTLALSYHEAFPGLGYIVSHDAFFDWTPFEQLSQCSATQTPLRF